MWKTLSYYHSEALVSVCKTDPVRVILVVFQVIFCGGGLEWGRLQSLIRGSHSDPFLKVSIKIIQLFVRYFSKRRMRKTLSLTLSFEFEFEFVYRWATMNWMFVSEFQAWRTKIVNFVQSPVACQADMILSNFMVAFISLLWNCLTQRNTWSRFLRAYAWEESAESGVQWNLWACPAAFIYFSWRQIKQGSQQRPGRAG